MALVSRPGIIRLVHPSDDPEREGLRERLLFARDIALANVATMPAGWARELNATMATIANHAALSDAAAEVMGEALMLCRHLIRDQAIAGRLEGLF